MRVAPLPRVAGAGGTTARTARRALALLLAVAPVAGGAVPGAALAQGAPAPLPAPTPALPLPGIAAEAAPPALHAMLMRRAAQAVALGDVSGARLLYARVASAGDGAATVALGRTYDPLALARMGVQGIVPDRAAAAALYRAGMALGDPEAEGLLRALEAGQAPAARNREVGRGG